MGTNAPRILVIDDDASMRQLVALHLRNAGYHAEIAEDALVGGRRLVESRPDLAIVDIDMPYMSGLDLVGAMRDDPSTRDIPVIFLTSVEGAGEQARRLNAVLLTKPLRADRLLDIVRRLT